MSSGVPADRLVPAGREGTWQIAWAFPTGQPPEGAADRAGYSGRSIQYHAGIPHPAGNPGMVMWARHARLTRCSAAGQRPTARAGPDRTQEGHSGACARWWLALPALVVAGTLIAQLDSYRIC